jgi:hypothetical protein
MRDPRLGLRRQGLAIELVATTEARSLSRLRGSEASEVLALEVGVGVLPQDALVERIGFPPPAALWRAIALPGAIAEARFGVLL